MLHLSTNQRHCMAVILQAGLICKSSLVRSQASCSKQHTGITGRLKAADDMQVALPLSLFCRLVAPQQAAVYKLTLDTNRLPPQLVELFQDMLAQAQVHHYSLHPCTSALGKLTKLCNAVSQSICCCRQHS